MGYPVSHSRSPVIHRLFALQTKQNLQYELLQVAPDKLELLVRQFQRTGGKGLNVTVPHKSTAATLCDSRSERAELAGAVNTLSFADGEISGDNTDGVGLLRDLKVNQRIPLKGKRILILGAGGATRGIAAPLLSASPAQLVIANRSVKKAEDIADAMAPIGVINTCGFDAHLLGEPFDLVINATSAGIHGETPPYPASAVGPESICYDLSYGLKATPFSLWARAQQAARSLVGWGMLVEQAAESFYIWRGIRPDTAPVLKQITISG